MKIIELHVKKTHDLISFNVERIDSAMEMKTSTEDGGIDLYTRIVSNGLMTDVAENYDKVVSLIDNGEAFDVPYPL